ncbi:endonuclease domain-containing protein [Protaetiibacter mangrovi]|uniref:Endonuclease domain-containing protein n=1 Tax=Protaetiibacter mangrovi TaxID=2970926 RepID=A0ABT1ZG50_9MICO|nr:endonuclease domain-containing protein [Protaetiibacter mangrovi]MCS0499662.1 endonuclease domain-containing protein [Protaetiibacter mangrovi]TPX02774.1 hypothetical protein FJ656_20640 [Schumannella luteola]
MDLARPFHGVREREAAHDLRERCASYATRMAPDEFFCSVTAALLHGIPVPLVFERDPTLHVAVPNPRRGPRSRGVRGHKFVVVPRAGEVVVVHQLPTSSPERAWCELGAVLELEDLVAAGDHLIRPANRMSSSVRLRGVLERHPAPRSRKLLHEAFALLDPGAESPRESKMRLVFVRAGLTVFRVNLWVAIPSTGRRRRIDLAFEREKVAFEYQGIHHNDPHQWREDMTRIAELESIGWKVVFVNDDDLQHPERLVAMARRVLASRTR